MLLSDDTILICDTKSEPLLYVRMFLTCFKAVTGSNVNQSTSYVVLIGDAGSIIVLVDILFCKVGSLLVNNLDTPLGSSFKVKEMWNPIVKMEQ